MVRMTQNIFGGLAGIGMVAALVVAAGWSCGGSSGSGASIDIRLFGWASPDGSEGNFVPELEQYPGAREISVKLTQPKNDEILDESSASIAEGKLELPNLSSNEDVRLDFDVIGLEGGRGTRIASGATPVFTPGSSDQNFRVMVAPLRNFAPVGAQFAGTGGEVEYAEVRFDNSAADGYLGRVGHRARKTEKGRALVVGGARISSDLEPGSTPSLQTVHSDVQRFDPGSGLATDLSFDVENNRPRPGGADRLDTGRAFHTLTPIGDRRYLVIGGFTKSSGNLGLVSTIEVIDLSADPGKRVVSSALSLSTARARHTATYRPEADQVVVAGGVGSGGEALDSVEIIDLAASQVTKGPTLQTARAEHQAFLLEQSGESVWVVGGRSGSSALASTEVVTSLGQISEGPTMKEARFNFAAAQLSAKVALVCGGYTSTDDSGAPSDTCQIGRFDADSWGQELQMPNARGGARMVKLTQSKDAVLIGGRDASGAAVTEASRLNFQGRRAAKLYEVASGVGSMYKSRYQPTVTRLDNGMILLTGGAGFTNTSGDGVEECRRSSGSNCGLSTLRSFEYYNPGDVVRARGSDDGGMTTEGSGSESDDSTT